MRDEGLCKLFFPDLEPDVLGAVRAFRADRERCGESGVEPGSRRHVALGSTTSAAAGMDGRMLRAAERGLALARSAA